MEMENVNILIWESWPSGRRRTLGKRVGGQTSRGFESHTLRRIKLASHFNDSLLQTPPGQRCSNGSNQDWVF
jgi:hypothetical protein